MDNKRKSSDLSNSSEEDPSSLKSPPKERSRSNSCEKSNSRSNSLSSEKEKKVSKKRRNSSNSSNREDKKEKPAKKAAKKSTKRDDVIRENGEIAILLDQYKRLSIRKFKGKLLIDIREFYPSEGEMKPGRKGIALSLDNWNKISEQVDFINECINEIK